MGEGGRGWEREEEKRNERRKTGDNFYTHVQCIYTCTCSQDHFGRKKHEESKAICGTRTVWIRYYALRFAHGRPLYELRLHVTAIRGLVTQMHYILPLIRTAYTCTVYIP